MASGISSIEANACITSDGDPRDVERRNTTQLQPQNYGYMEDQKDVMGIGMKRTPFLSIQVLNEGMVIRLF